MKFEEQKSLFELSQEQFGHYGQHKVFEQEYKNRVKTSEENKFSRLVFENTLKKIIEKIRDFRSNAGPYRDEDFPKTQSLSRGLR